MRLFAVPKRVVFLLALYAILIFGFFSFYTTQVIDLKAGGDVWLFYLAFAFGLFVFSCYFFSSWASHPILKGFMVFLFLGLLAAVIGIGITSRPFDAANLQLRTGALQYLGPLFPKPVDFYNGIATPPSVTWAHLIPVIDQGGCGVCWAVASAAALHARIQIAKGITATSDKTKCNQQNWLISPQAIVDFSGKGCKPNTVFYAYELMVQMSQLPTMACVPYTISNCTNCPLPASVPKTDNSCVSSSRYQYSSCFGTGVRQDFFPTTVIRGYHSVRGASYMEKEIAKYGPITAVITLYTKNPKIKANWTLATKPEGSVLGNMGDYASPNYIARPRYDAEYNHSNFATGGHVVVIVGYGEQDGVKYWVVVNSWGTRYGYYGLIRIERGIDAWSIETGGVAAVEVE